MRKRVALASILLLAAVAAVLWTHRENARARARSATGREADAISRAPDAADGTVPCDALPVLKLFGRIIEDGTDTPVAGAAVSAYAFETARTFRATSAGDGTFDLPDAAAAGPVLQIVARHEGFGAASLRVVLSNDPVVVRLSPGGGIRGRVVSDEGKAPIPACRVLAVRTQGWDENWSVDKWLLRKLLPEEMAIEAVATTRSDGGFEMAHVTPGAYGVLALAEGQVLHAARSVEVEIGSTAEVEIREPGTAPLFLEVIDQDNGKPLDGARFEVVDEGSAAPLPAQCRGDGVYELRQGYYKGNFRGMLVRVRRPGYAPRILLVSGGWPGYRRRASLGRGAAIVGHVQTSTGPLPQALVFVVVVNTLVATAVTGADGGFEINGLDAPEDVIVFVLRPSLDPIAELRFPLRDGERHVLEVGGPGGAAIEGQVVLAGAPAARVWITLWGPCDSSATTGPDGAYAFDGLDPGQYDVWIRTDDQGEFGREVDVGKAQRVRLDIEAPCLLSGMVVDAGTAAPVTTLKEIVVRRVDAPSGHHMTARVDDDGRFRLYVEPGIYEIDCPDTPDVHVVERPRVDLTREIESGLVALRVERDPQDGRIVLDVKDARTGEPVPKGAYWQGRGPWLLPEDRKFAGERIEAGGLSLGLHRFRVWSDLHAPTDVEIAVTPERKTTRQAILLQPSEAVRIGYIQRGAPEAIAGLRRNDIILSFSSVAALNAALASARGAVAIEIERDGERKTVTLPSGEIEADLENILLGR